MNDFYCTCCDCGIDYCEALNSGQPILQCPRCGLTTTRSEIEKLSNQLGRDQPCRITRHEIQQEISLRFPKTSALLNILESRER